MSVEISPSLCDELLFSWTPCFINCVEMLSCDDSSQINSIKSSAPIITIHAFFCKVSILSLPKFSPDSKDSKVQSFHQGWCPLPIGSPLKSSPCDITLSSWFISNPNPSLSLEKNSFGLLLSEAFKSQHQPFERLGRKQPIKSWILEFNSSALLPDVNQEFKYWLIKWGQSWI